MLRLTSREHDWVRGKYAPPPPPISVIHTSLPLFDLSHLISKINLPINIIYMTVLKCLYISNVRKLQSLASNNDLMNTVGLMRISLDISNISFWGKGGSNL